MWLKDLWRQIVYLTRRTLEAQSYQELLAQRRLSEIKVEMLRNKYDSFPDKRRSVPRRIYTQMTAEGWKLESLNNELKYYGK